MSATDSVWKNTSLVSIMLIFMSEPLIFGTLLVRLPDIQQGLDLNKAELAIALIGLPIGALVMLPVAGSCVARIGVRKTLLFGFPVFLLSFLLVKLASNLAELFAVAVIVGLMLAFMELGLNMLTSLVEQARGKSIMNRAHGFWSLGLMLGSVGGVQLAKLGLDVPTSLAICGVVSIIPALAIVWPLPRDVGHGDTVAEQTGGWLAHRPSRTLVGLSVFIAGAAIAEGAAADWSAIYLREILGPDVPEAGYGLSLFAGFVAAVRLSGDWLKNRLGPVRMARILALIGLAGVVLIVGQFGGVASVFVGFALLGAGVAAGFPLAISAAGMLPGSAAHNIAFITFMAMLSFVIGPPLIGFVAEQTSLQLALALLLPFLLLHLFCCHFLRGHK